MVRYLDFSLFHNKRPPTGSTFIRMIQMEKYWPDFLRYEYGENPNCLIFQKVYCGLDYKFPVHFHNKKILDICDPDWLNGNAVKETADGMDAVVCATEPIKDFMKQLTDKPVVVIPDRFDLSVLPEPVAHKKKAVRAVWFGYAHNAEALKFGIKALENHDISLCVISNEDPAAWRWAVNPDEYKNKYRYKKYDEKTIYQELVKYDFAFLPKNVRPEDKYKSNNRTIKSNLVGLPVVYDKETLEKYISPESRQEWVNQNLEQIKKDYDIIKSVKQYQELIDEISVR